MIRRGRTLYIRRSMIVLQHVQTSMNGNIEDSKHNILSLLYSERRR
jgi:hypothetical protein